MSSVSVIIPSYNYAHYLRDCVHSALAQSTPQLHVEVLVIDDCSTDDTATVGTSLAASDSRIEFRRHGQNQGHLATYDEGLRWAQGDYCILLSADDLLVPGALRRAAAVLDAHPSVGFAYGRSIRFTTDDDRPPARTGEPRIRIWEGREWIAQRCRSATNCISSPEVVVRTSLQHRLGGYRRDLPHAGDLEMWLRLAAHGDVAYLGNVDQAYYRMHAQSMARTRFTSPLADLRQRKAAFDALFDDHGGFIADAQDLRSRAGRALAREALWSACHGMDRMRLDAEQTAELEAFAARRTLTSIASPPTGGCAGGARCSNGSGPGSSTGSHPPTSPLPCTDFRTGAGGGTGTRMAFEPIGTDLSRPDEWRGLVVLCAANNWDGIKLADQHLAEHLSDHAPVLYVDPPMSHLTPRNRPELKAALQRPRLRLLAPRLARLTPVVPPKGRHRLLVSFTDPFLRHLLRQATRVLGAAPRAVIVTQPSWPAFGAAGEEVSVFWAQDDFAGGAALMGLDAERVGRAELAAARMSDLMVTSSPAVRDRWADRGYPSVMIPFGCDAGAFAAASSAAPDVRVSSPTAGFVGHLNARTDLRLLEAVADTMSLLLIGPLAPEFEPARVKRLLARENVQWVGPQPFQFLPGYLAAIDVGLVPYDHGAFNIGSFPLKTLEYLAAGVPVVATGLPATRWLDTELVVIEDAPDRFAAAARSAAERRRDAAAVTARQAFATRHDWAARAEEMAELLDLHVGPRAAQGFRV